MATDCTYEVDEPKGVVRFHDWPQGLASQGEDYKRITLEVSFRYFQGPLWHRYSAPEGWSTARLDHKLAVLRVARDELIDRGIVRD